MSKTPIFTLNKEKICWRKIGDETVILDIRTDAYYTLNESGSLLWDTLVKTSDIEAAAQELAEHYAVDKETARKDIVALVDKLISEGILDK